MISVFIAFFLHLFISNNSNNLETNYIFNINSLTDFYLNFTKRLIDNVKKNYLSKIFRKKINSFHIKIENFLLFKSVEKKYKDINMIVYDIFGISFVIINKKSNIPVWIIEWQDNGFPPITDFEKKTEKLESEYIVYNNNAEYIFIILKNIITKKNDNLQFLKLHFDNIINLKLIRSLKFRLEMIDLGNKIREIYYD
jgi:hypothetical protein